jgi:hypothetical protein
MITRQGQFMGIYHGDEVDYVIFDTFYAKITVDPDDGYRSYLDDVIIEEGKPRDEQVTKFYTPLAKASLIYAEDGGYLDESNSYDILRVVGDDGYVWVAAGTSYSDDYYPCAYCDYNPRLP